MERNCIECGGALTKRAHESKKRFSKKQFCSTSCSRKYMKKNKLGWWSPESKGEKDFFLPTDYEY